MPHPLLTPFLTHCFQEGLDYFDKGADMIGIVGEAKCGLSISIMALYGRKRCYEVLSPWLMTRALT